MTMDAGPGSDLALARAVDDLRRGVPIRLTEGVHALGVLPAELASVDSLAAFEDGERADLLLTPERADTLRITNQKAAAGARAVAITRAPWLDLVASLAAADPVSDLAMPLKGPFPTRPLGAHAALAEAALALLKRAALLPAAFVRFDPPPVPGLSVVDAAAVLAWRRATRVRIVSRARLPLAAAPETTVVSFRPSDGGPEHLALMIGSPGPEPLVRVHSACLTGDVLGSLKCDCGPQLQAAVARLAERGGILLYLQQEGRGIGLLNKLRAYALQDQGFDTVDANLRLGFEAEERDFDLAAAMLRLLRVTRIRLLTNNPAKRDGLSSLGIEIAEMVPHAFGENAHNKGYLATKRDRQGHVL
jgi:GTP cyclohydrolase II